MSDSDQPAPRLERLQAVELRPGDVLIANVDPASIEDTDGLRAIQRALEGDFPGHRVVIVAGIDILVGRSIVLAP